MTASWIVVLKHFFNTLPQEKQKKLQSFLSTDIQQQLKKIPPEEKSIDLSVFDMQKLLDNVHYSWFIPTLKTYSSEEMQFFLSSLSSNREKLCSHFHIPYSDIPISEIGKRYFRSVLLNTIVTKDDAILPPELLPQSPLNPLANMTKSQLMQVIDYLSLYDLAAEIPKIVSSKTLKWISSVLSQPKRRFLKSKIGTKEPFSFPRLQVQTYVGKEQSFQNALHKRGLLRLGKALIGQHPHLLWHICHHLDIGRGSVLFEMTTKKGEEKIAKTLEEYIVEILQLLKPVGTL